MPLALNLIQKKFCRLQKKVLSFGPNRTLEVWPNKSAKPRLVGQSLGWTSFDFFWINSNMAFSITKCSVQRPPQRQSSALSLSLRQNWLSLAVSQLVANISIISFWILPPIFYRLNSRENSICKRIPRVAEVTWLKHWIKNEKALYYEFKILTSATSKTTHWIFF